MIRIYHRLKHITVGQSLICLFILILTGGIVKFYSFSNVWKSVSILISDESINGNLHNTWIEQQVHVNNEIVDTSGKLIAKVKDIQSINLNNHKLIFISFDALVRKSNRSNELNFLNQQILVTNPLELVINHAQIRGKVISISDSNKLVDAPTRIKVLVRYPNAQQWEINNIHPGDTIPQNQQNKLIEIKKIYIERPSYSFSTSYNNERNGSVFVSQNLASLRDILIELEVKAEKVNGVWYLLNTYPLRTNELISLDFPQISIKNATIQSVDYGNSN